MKLRVISLILLLVSLIVTASAVPATALSMPALSGDYQLKATSPSDDPSTNVIEVRPGEDITVQATATLTYKGAKITSPPISVTTQLRLLKGSDEKASATQTTTVDRMLLENGKSYTKTGSGSIAVPSNLQPGTYKLDCTANAQASVLGMGMSKNAADSFTVQVIGNPATGSGNGHVSSFPPEKPLKLKLKKILESWS